MLYHMAEITVTHVFYIFVELHHPKHTCGILVHEESCAKVRLCGTRRSESARSSILYPTTAQRRRGANLARNSTLETLVATRAETALSSDDFRHRLSTSGRVFMTFARIDTSLV